MNTLRSSHTLHAIAALTCSIALLAACGDDGDGGDDSTSNTTASNTTASNTTASNTTASNTTASNTTSSNTTSSNTTSSNTTAPGISMCGGYAPHTDLADAEACAACVDGGCCDEATACGDDADCLALRECFAGCEGMDGGCYTDCEDNATDAALSLNQDYVMCRNTSCADPCAIVEDWSCAGDTPEAPSSEMVTMSVVLEGFPDGNPVSGATVKVCAAGDLERCEAPLSTETTDAEGRISITLPADFGGYLEATGGNRFPSLLYFTRPPTEGRQESFPVLGDSIVNGFAGILGATIDPNRGHAALIALDCRSRTASGVQFTAANSDDQTTYGYAVEGLPAPEATATDSSGIIGIFNLPAGVTTISGEADGMEVFEREVQLRAGFITSGGLQPGQ